ncbi:MAG: hypothetical protein Q9191_000356 [Dirinaria sp. TL-2023a]
MNPCAAVSGTEVLGEEARRKKLAIESMTTHGKFSDETISRAKDVFPDPELPAMPIIFTESIDEEEEASLLSNMTSSTTSTATPPQHPFEKRVDEIKLSKDDLNGLVMDYLISEGYPDAAAKFAKEANVSSRVDVDTVHERVEIRNLIYREKIQEAIEKINEINPQLLDQDPNLHFALLRLQLIELIRKCLAKAPNDEQEFLAAQQFAEIHLGPRAPASPETLADLESTMLLLLFPSDKPIPEKAAKVLDPQLRVDIATRVNEAILESTGERTKARLFDLVRLRAWSEEKAREMKKDLPEHLDIGLDPPSPVHNGHNGVHESSATANGDAEPMVT